MNTLQRIADLQAKEKAYTAQIKEWKTERDALTATLDLGLVAEGDIVAEVKERRMFNAALAKQVLDPIMFDRICEKKPTATLAKKYLTGEEYGWTQKAVGKIVSFKEGV